MLPPTILVVLVNLASCVAAAPPQVPLQSPLARPRRPLHGRFLHITDIHPDPHYRVGAAQSSACHRKKPRKEEARAGEYGAPFSECDSPFSLTNLTLDFLEKHWVKEVDFVIWTGDSARHDNDRELPRTPAEIYELNRVLVRRVNDIFTRRDIPVVPSLGNNDVWPHNIMTAGPNSITNEFADIWRSFIPFSSYQVFQRGGYYTVEVIPDALAVVSLNTMYFYDSNKAVGGCEYTEPEDPGNLQFDWLEVQLDRYRDRDMQVWISGHVPPSPGNYFPGCFVQYADLALRFQDTILGHLYGHMNADHFFFLEKSDLILPSLRRSDRAVDAETQPRESRRETLIESLIKDFEELPKKKDIVLDDYAVINVSPSVVPNPYVPTFRVYSYNVTGASVASQQKKKGSKRKHGHRRPGDDRPDIDCKLKENRARWECRPKKPQHSDPESASRSNQLWSPLGYAQYWLPNVGAAGDGRKAPKYKLEYLTYALPLGDAGWRPVPLREVPRTLRNASRTRSKYAPYGMADLTIGSWVALGQRLGDRRRAKLRTRFEQYMYMGGEAG